MFYQVDKPQEPQLSPVTPMRAWLVNEISADVLVYYYDVNKFAFMSRNGSTKSFTRGDASDILRQFGGVLEGGSVSGTMVLSTGDKLTMTSIEGFHSLYTGHHCFIQESVYNFLKGIKEILNDPEVNFLDFSLDRPAFIVPLNGTFVAGILRCINVTGKYSSVVGHPMYGIPVGKVYSLTISHRRGAFETGYHQPALAAEMLTKIYKAINSLKGDPFTFERGIVDLGDFDEIYNVRVAAVPINNGFSNSYSTIMLSHDTAGTQNQFFFRDRNHINLFTKLLEESVKHITGDFVTPLLDR